MPTPEGVWAEYSIGTLIDDSVAETARIERVFTSELAAWRAAGPVGNRVVFVEWGETIEDAIIADQPPKAAVVKNVPATPRTHRPSKPKPEVLDADEPEADA